MDLLIKVFFTGLTILLSVNLLNAVPLNTIPLSMAMLNTTPFKCISMTNQECKVRPVIVNVNSDEPILYPFSIKTSKWVDICNNINDPYAKMCLPVCKKLKC